MTDKAGKFVTERQSIDLSFQLTEDEIVSATRQLYVAIYNFMFVAISPLLILAGGFLMLWLGNPLLAGMFFGIALVTLAIVAILVTKTTRERIRNNPAVFSGQSELNFSDDRILLSRKTIRMDVDWEYYSHVRESDTFYFLFCGKDFTTAIPKRAFHNSYEEEQFRALVSSKLGEILKLGKPVSVGQNIQQNETKYLPPDAPPDWR